MDEGTIIKMKISKQAKFKVVIAHMPPSADLNIWQWTERRLEEIRTYPE